ncbi:phosphatidate cytidylyltransferase [Flammeovirgaceae bacterium SG7u.111]|nr:phosphatidate cytidylyltransferase [Flammeovirgaceae bacterium SG7u.132]WPO35398.1 phosphatidate cytidylyltransferase [Flammeovirgaceae bacterium SG7u.111]
MRSHLNNLPELTQRIIAALFGASIILGAILWNEWSYFVIFLAICMLSMLEFYKLLGLDGNVPLKTYGMLNGFLMFLLTFLVEKNILANEYYMLIFVGLSAVYVIILYKKADKKPFTSIAFTFLGVIYVGTPFALLNMCAFVDSVYHYEIIIGLLFTLWGSDTGAYFAGKNFGRRPLFARVSPKKTWEGSVGGALTAIGLASIFAYYFPVLATWQWITISIIIVVAGTYGDLVESLFKRSIHIKDSGTTIPGHGGFLDRFDGLLIAAPIIVVFIKLF